MARKFVSTRRKFVRTSRVRLKFLHILIITETTFSCTAVGVHTCAHKTPPLHDCRGRNAMLLPKPPFPHRTLSENRHFSGQKCAGRAKIVRLKSHRPGIFAGCLLVVNRPEIESEKSENPNSDLRIFHSRFRGGGLLLCCGFLYSALESIRPAQPDTYHPSASRILSSCFRVCPVMP